MKDVYRNKKNELFSLISFLKLINTLSIDVVIGSVFSAFLVMKLFETETGWAFWIVLPLSVWIIYTTDHLIDAYRLKQQAGTHRHHFHFYYFNNIIVLVAIFCMLNLFIVITWLEKEIIYFGLVLTLATIFYLIFIFMVKHKNHLVPKEIIVSVIYTAGIWGSFVALNSFRMNTFQLLLLITFFLLVLSDILVLSYYEIESDKKDGHSTISVKFGLKLTFKFIFINLLTVFAICIFVISSSELFLFRAIAKLFLIMGLVVMIILGFPGVMKKYDLYRYFAEWVFWIPGLAILFL
jgi:4-hydroxybenzoate polyprenyltransferase